MKNRLSLFLLPLSLLSCQDDSEITRKIGSVQIYRDSIPDTARVFSEVPIYVEASASNNCWSDLFTILKKETDFTYNLSAYGTYTCAEGGCWCGQIMVYQDTVILFTPQQPGTYLFGIHNSPHQITLDTLIVIH